MSEEDKKITIGVLAIQGAVEEHINCLKKCGCLTKEIRIPSDINGVDGIVLPGGESTTMAIVGEKCGLFPVLKEWVKAKRPIWGTCAGMILLSDYAIKQKEGGQSLVGGLDVQVCRNFFGTQINSREATIPIDSSIFDDNSTDKLNFNAVFIRAPAILKTGKNVKVLGTIQSKPHASALPELLKLQEAASSTNNAWDFVFHQIVTDESQSSELPVYEVAVAVKQGNILATAFHPELTTDLRWHQAFVNMVKAFTIPS